MLETLPPNGKGSGEHEHVSSDPCVSESLGLGKPEQRVVAFVKATD